MMFEEKTYENLLGTKLASVNPGFDTREGSVIYDAMAPNSAETAQVYMDMGWMLEQMFGDTADREYLCKIAYDTRGLRPRAATHAILKGVFNAAVSEGSRFSLDTMNYTVTEALDEAGHAYKLKCETAGTEGNRYFGTLIPIDYIAGLREAELTQLIIPGEDEEGTEAFRSRWRNSFQSLSFGGNKSDYKDKIKSISGVGGVKVYRAADAEGQKKGGHVKCVVIASDFSAPAKLLIQEIQNRIDPFAYAGEGEGLAPVGHEVHIEAVAEAKVNVESQITYEAGYSFADIKSYLEAAIDDYFLEMNRTWEDSSQIAVRVSQIESRLLDVEGILDVAGTKLNGQEQNMLLDADSIAVRGEIHG